MNEKRLQIITGIINEEWGTPPNTDLMKVQNWINQKDDDGQSLDLYNDEDEPSNDGLPKGTDTL